MGLSDLFRNMADDIDFVKDTGNYYTDVNSRLNDLYEIGRYAQITGNCLIVFRVIRVLMVVAAIIAWFVWK